ncbi:hypothetical protein SY83_20605 [Paenibacillus swuensis]|uniref:HTH merR-type domain-containing protein n=1 Tax=Paenibacillus swuensis TaxID=1178515 RepID=A0A172TMI6_9BACL|nr:MerR family transcriptional regulator [Paenibacillus swuensis]ANE48289.1 hypothetical protein SY83_20605 [Paenibacillus swuensis]
MAANLYRIGTLSKLSEVSQRTIDYYTTMGLIQPEKRTDNNYRLYSDDTLTRLKRIEMMKKEKYTLEEIRTALKSWNKVSNEEELTEKFTTLQMHMQQLEREVKELSPIIEHLKPNQIQNVFKNLTPQGAACIEALLLLLGKGPLM